MDLSKASAGLSGEECACMAALEANLIEGVEALPPRF
jgi:hypothetical protein